MLPRADWQGLIPHAGAMCLLDEVVAWDEASIHARTGSHRAPDNPLRSAGMLRALNLCEYGAQAMAVHGGLLARAHGGLARPGLLVALRDVELFVARIDDLAGDLDVHAAYLGADPRAWQYAFRIAHRGLELARGRATVVLSGSPQGGPGRAS
jgi:predicted hotdog family 3-hydroxylacyl-ACP dehydratase